MKCKLMSASLEGCHRVGQMEVSMTTSIIVAQSGPPAGADYKCISPYTSFHFSVSKYFIGLVPSFFPLISAASFTARVIISRHPLIINA